MSIYNDRLGVKKNRKNFKINIPLDLACSNTPKILQKEKIDGICINNDRLVGRKNRQDSKVNISLVMESANAQKDEKEKIDEMDSTVSNMFTSQ